MQKRFSPFLLILIFLILIACNGDYGHNIKDSEDSPYALRDQGFASLTRQNPKGALEAGEKLIKIGESEKKPYFGIYGRILVGQGMFLLDSIERVYPLLHEAELMAIEQKNDSALASIYNGLGLYTSNVFGDQNETLRYFFKGLDAANRSGNQRVHSLLLSNISLIYSMSNDRASLRYASECYEEGKKHNDPVMQYIGALNMALAYLNAGSTSQALNYVKKAEFLLHQNDVHDYSNLYYTYGLVCRASGQTDDAVAYFKQSLNPGDGRPIVLRSYVNLAEIARQRRDFDGSLALLKEALRMTEEGHEPVTRPELLHQMALTYKETGNSSQALKYEQMSLADKAERQSQENTQAIEQLKAKYDMERAENEVIRQKTQILEKETEIYVLFGVVIIVILLAVFMTVLYRRKNRMYSVIVRQMTEAARHEEALQSTISNLEKVIDQYRQSSDRQTACEDGQSDGGEAKAEPSTQDALDEKSLALLARFETLMADPKTFSDNLLSKDRVAKLLGTNRTYISAIVNRRYNLSFTEYLNRIRIREAIRLLSDPENTDSLKTISEQIGYNSTTTFYTQFKEETGMTPAAFRKQAQSLSK